MPDDQVRETGRGRVLAGLMLAMGLAAMDATIVATAVPSIVADLGGFAQFPWVFSIYMLATAVTVPVYGKLADLHGRKPVLLAGMVVFLVGSALCGLAWNMAALIVFRGLQGVGAGTLQSMTATVAGDLYSLEERGRVQGWLSSVWGMSAVVGPTLGGALAEYATWRWIFYINVPIGVAALFMVGRGLHESVTRRPHRIDFGGAVLLMAGTGLLIFNLLQAGVSWPWVSAPSLALFAAALLGLAGFVAVERRAVEPIVPSWVYGRRLLVAANLGSAAVGLLTIGMSAFLPAFAQHVLGAGPTLAGFTLAVMSIGWPLASSGSARLYLRIGFRDTALIGLSLCLVAGVFLGMLPATASVAVAAGGSFVMGAGLGLTSTPLLVGVQSVVGWRGRGVVTGASMFARMLGSAVGAAVYGSIANSVFAARLRTAPADVARRLPRSVDAAVGALRGTGAVAQYVRHGLYAADLWVFRTLALVAAAGLVAVLLAPRRFAPLTSEDTPAGRTPETDVSGERRRAEE